MSWDSETAAEVVDYLKEYASVHGFSQDFRLGTEVLEIVERSVKKRRLHTRDVATGEESAHHLCITPRYSGRCRSCSKRCCSFILMKSRTASQFAHLSFRASSSLRGSWAKSGGGGKFPVL